MRAWLLDALAIVAGVCIAEVVIQLYITPTITRHAGKAEPNDSAAVPW